MKVYKGYATHSLDDAAKWYTKRTGFEPTVLLVRPDYEVTGAHPGLVRSRLAAWGMICATHLLTSRELSKLKRSRGQAIIFENEEPQRLSRGVNLKAAPSKHVDLDRSAAAHCPHCQQRITDFEDLGWWWGWRVGIDPTYWAALRLYVFSRDEYTCQNCHRRFSSNGLECHHIQPKEEGGADSSRNLITLCKDCHLDTKPIMPEMPV